MSQPPPSLNYQIPPRPQSANPMAIISMVAGILSCVTFCKIWVSIPFAVVAIVLSVIASGQIKKSGAGGKGMALAGLILGIIGAVIAVIMYVIALLFFAAARKGGSYLEQKAKELQAEQQKAIEQERQRQEQLKNATQPSSLLPQHLEWRLASGQTVYLVMAQS